MKNSRRNFLKFSSLAGLSLAGAGITKGYGDILPDDHNRTKPPGSGFNMSGYSAPKLETIGIGFIGIGNRGRGAVVRMNKIEGVYIRALSDIVPSKIDRVKKRIDTDYHNPVSYTKNQDDWKKLCERPDIDLVYIATPWALHTPMALYAMEHGKHVCVEVPAATTIDECWQLVETSERTKKHCMMLENCCYDFFELLTLNMARQGFFGEIIHCEGAYIHSLTDNNFKKTKYQDMWRLKENMNRNGNLYPTHGLGPICQVMNINRGDKFDYLVSMSSNDFMMGKKANELAATDNFYADYANKNYRGNINTTTIRTELGRTIMVQHDVTSPRPYSRIHLISGTNGSALKYPLPGKISTGHEWLSEEDMKAIEEKYTPLIVKKMGEAAKKVGGHGGMDFLMDWRTIDCLRNGLPLDQDVYDAALWSSVMPLSETSIKKKSNSVDVPDFTRGRWKTNKPVDLLFEKGGNTKVRESQGSK